MRFLLLCVSFIAALSAQDAATNNVLLSPRAPRDAKPTADPDSPDWKNIPGLKVSTGRFGEPVPGLSFEVRTRWTPRYLSVLWINPYQDLNLKLGPTSAKETWALWEFDVAELFIGGDPAHPRRYKEFQLSPANEWIDLDVDRDRAGLEVDWRWDSGFEYRSVLHRDRKLWIAEMRIPWRAIDPRPATPGREYHANIYRIAGREPSRQFLAWRPLMSPSYHTPEKFGKIRLVANPPR